MEYIKYKNVFFPQRDERQGRHNVEFYNVFLSFSCPLVEREDEEKGGRGRRKRKRRKVI